MCNSAKLTEFSPAANDTIIVNDIPLTSIGDLSDINTLVEGIGENNLLSTFGGFVKKFLPTKAPSDYKLFLTYLSNDALPLSSVRLPLFHKVHFASNVLKNDSRVSHPSFIAPSFCKDLLMSGQKPEKTGGIIGSIKRQNNIEEAVEQALLDGMETVIIFGYMKDPVYYYSKIVPLINKHPGQIKYAGFMDDRQKMYDAVSDVYSSVSKPWSAVRHECTMTYTRFHAPESPNEGDRMANDQIFGIWKDELAL